MHKLLLLLSCLVGSSLAGEGPEFEAALKKCAPSFPSVDKNMMDKFCDPDFETKDKDSKCLVKCLGQETGFSTADGKLIVDKFLTSSTKEAAAVLEPELKKCAAMDKSEACETAYEQWRCFCAVVRSEGSSEDDE